MCQFIFTYINRIPVRPIRPGTCIKLLFVLGKVLLVMSSEVEFSNRKLSTRYHWSCNITRTARFWLQKNKRQISKRETFGSRTTCTNSTITGHKFILMQIKLKSFVNTLLSAQKGSFGVARRFCQQNTTCMQAISSVPWCEERSKES